MIPFKAAVTPSSGGSGRMSDYEAGDYGSGSRRVQEYKRFGSSGGSEGRGKKQKQFFDYTGDRDDEPAFWSCSRFWASVRLKGGIWQEISGALGDAGEFVPAVLGLALVNGLDLGTTFVFTGIFNLLTGLVFGIPMPVQPMSAIVTVALSPNPLTVPQIMAAGISTGLVLAFLGITRLMNFFYGHIPIPVLRGVMLCEGLTAGFQAVQYILEKQDLTTMQSLGRRNWLGVNGLVLPISMLFFLIVVSGVGKSTAGEDDAAGGRESGRAGRSGEDSGREPLLLSRNSSSSMNFRSAEFEANEGNWRNAVTTVPTALIILLIALSMAIARNPRLLNNLQLGPSPLTLIKISLDDWKIGFLQAAKHQIPVSMLNSAFSLSKLSSDLFPGENVTTPNAVCISVGAMNVLGCSFGAVPVCHGVVGLAGQYRFGARSGLSMVILGTAMLALGLLLGSSFLEILAQFPVALLGILLLSSGLELAIVCRDQNSRRDYLVMAAVAVVSIGNSGAFKTLVGFLCGLVLYLVVKLHQWVDT
ncbi:hypothetical protein Mapa_003073 [Marchantia paleacea]|nr:hypothetical protein Mapa_003073 [Marchantia paleacea]